MTAIITHKHYYHDNHAFEYKMVKMNIFTYEFFKYSFPNVLFLISFFRIIKT